MFEVLRLGHLRQRQLSEQGGRTGKPDNVEFSIGQVVKHKRYGYRGVLVGWDKVCSAPKEWQEAMRIDQLQDKDGQAFYHTLVDTRDRPGEPQRTYMAAENVQLHPEQGPVNRPEVESHFFAFDPLRGHYIPKEGLRAFYPDD